MGLILLRWSAGVLLGCAAVAIVLLPFPANAPESWRPVPAPGLALEISRMAEAANRTDRAVRSYRVDQALQQWRARRSVSADTAAVRFADDVPPSVAESVRTVAAEQWAALGTGASASHAQIYVYVDSTVLSRSAGVVVRRPLEPRRIVDVEFALPEATDGDRCVAVVRLRSLAPANVDALRNHSLLGVCGFFAAFGRPGNGVRDWLTSTGYRAARRSDWHIARAPAVDATARYGLSDPASRCLTGDTQGCADALQLRAAAPAIVANGHRLDWTIDGGTAANTGALGAPRGLFGDAEPELLLSAVREFGPERFGEFWRSPEPPATAFLSATGTTIESWVERWASRTYGATSVRPSVRVRDVAWLVLALPVLLIIAARARERVLSERLVATRA